MKLAVREWGEAGDVPIVFWHALGANPSAADLAGDEIADWLVAQGL